MDKLAYRVHWRDLEDKDFKSWQIAACFVSQSDATQYVRDKTNTVPREEDTLQWRIMKGKQVITIIK